MPRYGFETGTTTVDTGDFEAAVRSLHGRLMAYALALVRRREVAEDLVQDAFLTAYRKLEGEEPVRDFAPWLRGILRMKYLEWARSRKAASLDGALLDSIEREHRRWDEALEEGRGDALEMLRHCLDGLEGLLRETVDLFYLDHRSCAEIAGRLGTTESATRKRLQRAREILADCVRDRLGSTA